jgi:hypothetical protein
MEPLVDIMDPTDSDAWDALVAHEPTRGPFHLSGWAAVLRDSYGYRPTYFMLKSPGGGLAAVPAAEVAPFPLAPRGVSLPFSDYCEPLLSGGAQFASVFQAMLRLAESRNWRTLEVRGAAEHLASAPPSAVYAGHRIALYADEERMQAGLADATRRNLRRARGQELTVTFDRSLDAVRQFYHLHCATRRRHGAPPQPFRFFRGIQKHLLAPGHGAVALALHRGRAIAASVFLYAGNNALYKFGASDAAHRDVRANHLLMWEAMCRFAREGRSELHLGRTDVGNAGLRRYKLGWGAQEYPLHYFRFDVRSRTFHDCRRPRRTYEDVMRRLPLALLRVVGWCLYRYQG